jgi:hypothetical protein
MRFFILVPTTLISDVSATIFPFKYQQQTLTHIFQYIFPISSRTRVNVFLSSIRIRPDKLWYFHINKWDLCELQSIGIKKVSHIVFTFLFTLVFLTVLSLLASALLLIKKYKMIQIKHREQTYEFLYEFVQNRVIVNLYILVKQFISLHLLL